MLQSKGGVFFRGGYAPPHPAATCRCIRKLRLLYRLYCLRFGKTDFRHREAIVMGIGWFWCLGNRPYSTTGYPLGVPGRQKDAYRSGHGTCRNSRVLYACRAGCMANGGNGWYRSSSVRLYLFFRLCSGSSPHAATMASSRYGRRRTGTVQLFRLGTMEVTTKQ